MTFECKYEVQDYVEGYRTYAKRSSRRWYTRFFWFMAVLVLAMGLFVAFGSKKSSTDSASPLPAFLVAALWIYCATGLWSRAGRRAFSGRPELKQEYKVDIGDSGIVFDGPISGTRWTWPAFVRFVEDKNVFLVFLSPCAFVVLPKRILAPELADQLRDLLRQKLPVK